MPSLLPGPLEGSVLRLAEDIGTPRALTVSLMVRNGEWDQLASLRCDPGHYAHPHAYYKDVCITDVLRKCEDLPTTGDRRAVALQNFWKAERMCYWSNERLSPYLFGGSPPGSEAVESLLVLARKVIAQVLGPCPSFVEGRFGPGATYADKGKLTTIPDKMSSCPTLTRAAIPWLFQWASTAWASACADEDKSPQFVRGNRFTTVPKDCLKDRGIAIEPSINLFFQLGFGRVMKQRLLAAGLDLKQGQEHHRRAACEASIRGHLATIDLSNASDTVCRNLVKLLLPPTWFSTLDDLRSPTTEVDGKRVVLEKFSSMGNGFTFELETCLFFGIASAAIMLAGGDPIPGVNVLVYGDDIIVPTEFAREVISALRFCGFETNVSKTFVEGPFRESCGGDFFGGLEVRPHYLKEYPREPSEWIALANGLYRLGRSDNSGRYTHLFSHRARLHALQQLPSNIRGCRGPKELGDIVIHDREDKWSKRTRDSIRYLRCWKPADLRIVPWRYFTPSVTLAAALYGVPSGTEVTHVTSVRLANHKKRSGGVIPRDAVLGHQLGWVPYS